jgi:hypothetical protein
MPRWPFRVELLGDPGRRAPLDVRVDAEDPAESLDVLDSVFETFDRVARAGGFGPLPDEQDAGGSGATWLQHRPGSGDDLVWRFRQFPFDHRSLSVLLSAIEGTEEPVRGVTIVASAGGSAPVVRVGDCPPPARALPFEIEERVDDDQVRVEIEFAHDLPPTTAAGIVDDLEYWADLGVLGGYRRPTAESAGESVLNPMEDVLVDRDAVSFTLSEITASECAFDVLLNILAQISHTVARVERVSIS